ncbi:MAG: AAA family ATPase [Parachlamydiales bacterium]|jgi:ATP-dependent Clp protease ATP-binding subunit ClpA
MYNSNDLELDCRIGKKRSVEISFDSASRDKEEDIYRNLTDLSNDLVSIIGREDEIKWMCHRLLCRFKPNILLVGESGVGKTALVEGLAKYAKQSYDNRVNSLQFREFSAGSLIAGTSYRGDFEKKIINLVNHLAANKSHVIFIDEAHALAMTGDIHGGGVDALNLLKPFLTSGEIRCILATTPKELTPLAADKAFMRRFGILQLQPLSKNQMCEALRKKGDYLSKVHNIKIENTFYSFVEENYINLDYGLDSALDFIDEVLAAFSFDQNQSIHQLMQTNFARFLNARRFLNELEFRL